MSSPASTISTAPTAASASASVKTPEKGSISDIFKGILYYTPMIVGILIIIISYGVHFATITYGTSGSDFVGTNLNSTVWPLVIGLLFFFVGFIVWIWSGLNSEYRFFGLFLLCLACLLSSNAALYFSLIQVTVTPK
jgi:hypothetical protein